jgi:hypothetical protein
MVVPHPLDAPDIRDDVTSIPALVLAEAAVTRFGSFRKKPGEKPGYLVADVDSGASMKITSVLAKRVPVISLAGCVETAGFGGAGGAFVGSGGSSETGERPARQVCGAAIEDEGQRVSEIYRTRATDYPYRGAGLDLSFGTRRDPRTVPLDGPGRLEARRSRPDRTPALRPARGIGRPERRPVGGRMRIDTEHEKTRDHPVRQA